MVFIADVFTPLLDLGSGHSQNLAPILFMEGTDFVV